MERVGNVKIPLRLWRRILRYYEETYSGVIGKSYSMTSFSRHRLESCLAQLKRLKTVGVKRNSVCLDAGCGIGTFVTAANLAGHNYYGYEIDPGAYGIAVEMLKANGLSPTRIQSSLAGSGFKGKKFDFISSFEVVEHVADLNGYLRGLHKVIKKNGRLFIETPNYNVPYEPHFYIFFPPGPTVWKWWCCQLVGRTNKKFFDELRFVTPNVVERALKEECFKFENVGLVEWSHQLLENEIQGRSVYVHWLSRFLRITGLGRLAKWLASKGIYTPLVYIARPG